MTRSWDDYLTQLDEVLAGAEHALAERDLDTAAEILNGPSARPSRDGLPPLPTELADHARRTICRLAALEGAVQKAMARLHPELALLGRRAAGTGPQYVDTNA